MAAPVAAMIAPARSRGRRARSPNTSPDPAAEKAEQRASADATEDNEPNEATDPSEHAEPTEPIERKLPLDPIEKAEYSDRSERAGCVNSVTACLQGDPASRQAGPLSQRSPAVGSQGPLDQVLSMIEVGSTAITVNSRQDLQRVHIEVDSRRCRA